MKVSKGNINQNNLWKEIREGNTKAFDQLYDEYIDILFSFGMTYTSDAQLVKDSIHDLFFELYKYRKNLSPTNNPRNYLFKSLKRKIFLNQSKRLKVVYRHDNYDSSDFVQESVEENIIQDEQNVEVFDRMKKAINNLPERQKEVIKLKFNVGLSYVEISRLMNISVESARTLIYRSIKLLKENI